MKKLRGVDVPGPGFYYHHKHDPEKGVDNHAYEVLYIGFHTEDNCRPGEEHFMVYRPLYQSASVYREGQELGFPCADLRPLKMFMENVTKDGKIFPRFQRITDKKVIEVLRCVRDGMY